MKGTVRCTICCQFNIVTVSVKILSKGRQKRHPLFMVIRFLKVFSYSRVMNNKVKLISDKASGKWFVPCNFWIITYSLKVYSYPWKKSSQRDDLVSAAGHRISILLIECESFNICSTCTTHKHKRNKKVFLYIFPQNTSQMAN